MIDKFHRVREEPQLFDLFGLGLDDSQVTAAIGRHVIEPLHTGTSKDRFGVATVKIAFEMYIIVDIGMRILSTMELVRAQGFPDTNRLTGTMTNEIARISKSVRP